ncbi:AbrB/MazE/SpoVT family DNA-binding domain-containing protein [Clostridium aminobutyricum]|uniref:AbrB family transcriptional regulator n=1 Tax=Clostridium aminobutyricum TaxID=33953 RepID=A0A939DBT4_CLOAM|nr:AbrB/MazE/SpoVT family DNA-binding domain-containing protein [Clostridium aminobutyricum]MBN7774378.1 AbrB family transcriptional regulator [Clostridium aminobutyricum]
MRSTGIVRKVDELGRIALPIELRKNLDIDMRGPIEIYADKDSIMLKKYDPSCILCGSMEELTSYMGKNICKKCIKSF